jgi:VWFA-related protein
VTANIKVTTTSVAVDVIVTDNKGRHVGGLTASDFRVYENDVPQKIVSFNPPVEPAKAAPLEVQGGAPPIESDATRAQQTQTRAQAARQASVGRQNPDEIAPPAAPASAARGGGERASANITAAEKLAHVRFITIVFDIADIQAGNLKRAREAAEKYLKTQVAPEDFVAIYRVDSSLHLAQPFTQDKDQAARALKKISEHVTTGLFTAQQRFETQEEIDAIVQACASQQGGFGKGLHNTGCDWRGLKTLQDYLWNLSLMQARAVFVALRAIAQSYADIPGRKNVVVFSEGLIHSPEAQAQLSSTIDAANRANVAFYIIDASGLTAPFQAQSKVPEITDNAEAFVAANAGPGSNKFDWIGRLGKDNVHDDLQQLATGTGGLLLKNQNDLLAGLSRVDRDLREAYTLVYQPANPNYDGAFRHIRVEVAKQRYHLRYRLGYWAIPPGEEMLMSPAAAQLLAGVASGELRSNFVPDFNGTVLLAPNGRLAAPVRVTLPAKEVRFERDLDRDVYHGGITFLLLARDSAGHIVSAHQRFINLEFDSRQLAEFQKQMLSIDARMAIPKLEPLTLEVILQFADGTIAIGKQPVALAGGSAGLELTGLLLTNRVQADAGTPDSGDPLRGEGFQLEVPAKPQFAPGEKLIAILGALNVPQDTSTGKPDLKLSFSIRQSDAVTTDLLPERAVGAVGQNTLVVLKQITLRSLLPGKYTLRVTSESASGQAANRSADFIIARPPAGAESSSITPETFMLGSNENPAGIIRWPSLNPFPTEEAPREWSVLNMPLSELARTAHELKGITPATGQDELPLILKRLGDNAESFVRNIPNTASTEGIQQQTLDSENDSVTHEFRYLALTKPGALVASLNEFRQDSGGHEVEAQRTMKGSPIVTSGFVSMPLLFHPQYQSGSDFRLLGRQAIEKHDTYVVGFAQRSATPLSIHMNAAGSWGTFLIQGVAWVDTGTYQILRMKTWLLPGQTRLADVTTIVDFGEVHFKHNSLAFWLPKDVVVEVAWKGKLYVNHHHYSGYRFFSVEAGEKSPRS